MKTTSAVESSSATLGLGSNVCELVPSGTIPVMSTRSPPMPAAMLVIGATVVATSSLPSSPLPAASAPQPAATVASEAIASVATSVPAPRARPRPRRVRRSIVDTRRLPHIRFRSLRDDRWCDLLAGESGYARAAIPDHRAV